MKNLLTTRGVILLALIATVVLSLISYRSIVKLNSLAEWVDHTHVVQINLHRTYSALSDADSHLKSFLITKDSAYYENLVRDEEIIRHSIASLRTLTSDNESQNRNIGELDSLIEVRWTLMKSDMKGEDPSHYDYFSAEIEKCNLLLKAMLQNINLKEEDLLRARSDDKSRYQSSAPFYLLAFQLVIVLSLLIGFFQVTADLKMKEKLQLETLEKNKELKEQKDFIQGIFENTVDVIIIFDVSLNMIALNKRARELYDQNGKASGKNVFDSYPQVQGSDIAKALQEALKGKRVHTPPQESLVYPGVFYESFFVPLYSGQKIIGVMAIHHDVSDLIKMTSDIRAINTELQKSNHELEQFAYVTSHDLQEPLRKIQTFSDLAKRNIDDKEIVSKNLERLSASAARMTSLIRDVLNYSRLSSSNSNLEEVDLNDVLDQVLQDFELVIGEKDALIESTRLPKVLGSPLQLTQVFSNIISNALKFCTAIPCIKIECQHQSGSYVITFTDNGIGFDQKYAEQIFKVFQRLHNRNEFSGTGIGLALCKRIVENHKGSIKATSVPGRGTTITITLPDQLKQRKTDIVYLEKLEN